MAWLDPAWFHSARRVPDRETSGPHAAALDRISWSHSWGTGRGHGHESVPAPPLDLDEERSVLTTHGSSLQDLAGRVRIRSVTEALNFVRLRGSPALVHVFRDYPVECEVVDRRTVDSSYVFGARDVLKYLEKRPPGMFGYGDSNMLKKSDARGARVVSSGGKYLITRTLLTVTKPGQLRLVTVSEEVSPNGSYAFRSLASVSTRGVWSFDFPL